MKDNINTNIKLSQIYGLPFLNKFMNEGVIDMTIENIIKRFNEIELNNKKSFSSRKATKISKRIIKISDNIILNESKLILLNEQEYIKLINPFNSKLTSINNHIYTFTNKSYKKINKN